MNGHQMETMPTWAEYRTWVRNEELSAAVALLGVDPYGVVQKDAVRWLCWRPFDELWDTEETYKPEPVMDWKAWVADVDRIGRGWSSTQWRLYDLVAGLATGREFNIVGVLDRLNEWAVPAWRVLMTWAGGASADQIRAAAPH